MQDNYFDTLYQMFEFEYLSFLSKQKKYNFNVNYDENIIKLYMCRMNSENDIPEAIDCVFSCSNGVSYVTINDITFEYQENILKKYFNEYTACIFTEDDETNKVNEAAILLGIRPEDILNEKIIKEKYRKVINYLHPDKWQNEEDIDIINSANSNVVKMTDAKNILIENLKGDRHEA
jgi:hypothetical protein